MILFVGRGSNTIILIQIFVRILPDLHDCVQHVVTAGLDSHLHLLLQLIDLIECLVKFHLKVVSFKDNCLEMHLLTPDYMLF